MTTKERYESAKELYASIGVNTDKASGNPEKDSQFPCTAGRETM